MADHPSGCGATESEEIERPRIEVADVLRLAVDNGHVDPDRLTPARAKVLRAINGCRTAALGGHADLCLDCGHVGYSYNSCRNRHCPRCQWTTQQKWIAGRLERLLDTHYFHVVFTLPAELRLLALRNQRQLYGLLFRAASRTLLELGRDPKRLGATLGITAVLHTWARNLSFHPHVHCLVTGGGLSLDETAWNGARPRYLFPVDVMGALMRGKFLAGLRKLHARGELMGVPDDFDRLVDRLYRTKWLVYAKRPMAGPTQVIKYLGRYTHRVAISSSRILDLTGDHVTFRTRGDGTCRLHLSEFARRFLLHVLPKGFMKIRHYGLFAAANIRAKWAVARDLRPVDVEEDDVEDTEPPVVSCEACGSTRLRRIPLEPGQTFTTRAPTARGPPPQTVSGGSR